jgi:hypothetical protein
MTLHLRSARRLFVRGAVLLIVGAVFLGQGGVPVARAAEPTSVSGAEPAPAPEQVRALIELLSDPQVRDWLREQVAERSAEAAATPEGDVMGFAEGRLEAIRAQLRALAAAVPRLPSGRRAAWATLERDLSETEIFGALLLIGAFVGLGFGRNGCTGC